MTDMAATQLDCIAFFDTETTGFIRKNVPHNDPQQASCCQLAAMLCDMEGNELARVYAIIKPTNWSIHPKVAEIHGITTERAMSEGRPIEDVLREFAVIVEKAKLLVAHNFKFDSGIMEIESFNFPEFVWRPGETFCTMLVSTDICKIVSGRGGYKWPKLIEIYEFLFGKEEAAKFALEAHDAMADIVATKRVYFELRKRGHIAR